MFRDVYYITVDGPSCERARKLFNLHGLPIGCVLLNEKNIFQQAQTLMEQGAKIFIARGGVAAIVKRLVPVLVVPLSYDFIDFYYPVMEACSRSEKVVVVGWYQHILWFEEYKKLLPSKVRYVDPPNFQSPNTEELWEVVRQLKEEGFEYFVGGSVVENEAIRLGAQGLQVNVSDEAYLQAAREALHYTHILKERELWYHTAEVILEHVREGFVFANLDGQVLQINQNARNILLETPQQSKEALTLSGLGLSESLQRDLSCEKPIVSRVFNAYSGKGILDGETLYIRGDPIGRLLTVQSMESIRQMEKKLRLDSVRSGHYAKTQFQDILGQSPAILQARQTAKLYAASSAAVLITGESGTGKEMFAQAIHNAGSRSKEPFVAVNCATVPANLLESELFGYVKGAFTGARSEGKAGIFETADKGTIFLDEIGEMPFELQSRLLRVLQEKEITRVGDLRVIPVDARIIAATNRNLYQAVQEKTFREDLFYRLCVLSLALPPLRSRKEDVSLLIRHFLRLKGRSDAVFTEGAFRLLKTYDWPGNVREVVNFVERVCALQSDDIFDEELTRMAMEQPGRVNGTHLYFAGSEADRQLLLILRECRGGRTEAAQVLGISRSTLWRKLKDLEQRGIKLP